MPVIAPIHAHTHTGSGTGGCVYDLLYFSTKRETRLSICTGTTRSGTFPGRLSLASGAEILR